MAGYLFALDSIDSLSETIRLGLFSTRLSNPNAGKWSLHHEGTFADYASMEAGDNVYFFIQRKIYGIGILVNIEGNCKSLNYPGADEPFVFNGLTNNRLLYLYPMTSYNQLTQTQKDGLAYKYYKQQFRFVCFFQPFPFFFSDGIDMDDMLSSDPPSFKILRDFYQKSLIKLDDVENQAFKNLILRRFSMNEEGTMISNYEVSHHTVAQKLIEDDYSLIINTFLNTINEGVSIRHEMAIEAAIIFQLRANRPNTVDTFGSWDYLSHQVPASPSKPNNYLDRVDIFGYSYLNGYAPTKSRFLVIEVKRDAVGIETLSQLMKYVDFIRSEYAYNDYSMINAYLVAFDFDQECIEQLNDIVTRNYIHGIRPTLTRIWNNVSLVRYRYIDNHIDFEIVAVAGN